MSASFKTPTIDDCRLGHHTWVPVASKTDWCLICGTVKINGNYLQPQHAIQAWHPVKTKALMPPLPPGAEKEKL